MVQRLLAWSATIRRMNERTVLLLGATGLVGRELLALLLQEPGIRRSVTEVLSLAAAGFHQGSRKAPNGATAKRALR